MGQPQKEQLPRIVLEPSSVEAVPVRLSVPELGVWLDLPVSEAVALLEDNKIPASVCETLKQSVGVVEKHLVERWEQHGWGLSLDVEMFRSSPSQEGAVSGITSRILADEAPAEGALCSGSRSRPLIETLLKRRSLRKYRLENAPAVDFEYIMKGSRISVAGMPDIRTRSGLRIDDLQLRRLAVIYAVDGYVSGIYREQESDGTFHLLRPVPEDELRSEMRSRKSGMPSVLTANWTVLWLVNMEKLLDRPSGTCSALTDLYLLFGVWCQEYLFHAENLKYGSLITPAVNDKTMGEFVEISGPLDVVVYTATTGRRLPRHH